MAERDLKSFELSAQNSECYNYVKIAREAATDQALKLRASKKRIVRQRRIIKVSVATVKDNRAAPYEKFRFFQRLLRRLSTV